MPADERTWRIGEVATATGLTVRALHHYDQIGLVVPSIRTSGGHRLYTGADLVLLYEVTAMRQLGLSLEQVGTVLAGRTDVRKVIDQQLEHVDRQIQLAQRLRKQLIAARDAASATSSAACPLHAKPLCCAWPPGIAPVACPRPRWRRQVRRARRARSRRPPRTRTAPAAGPPRRRCWSGYRERSQE
jgi:DNA-binding transcriptional MerR regulator